MRPGCAVATAFPMSPVRNMSAESGGSGGLWVRTNGRARRGGTLRCWGSLAELVRQDMQHRLRPATDGNRDGNRGERWRTLANETPTIHVQGERRRTTLNAGERRTTGLENR